MLVQDPTKGSGPDIEGFFEHVRQMGARPVQYEQNPSNSSSGIFTGTGRTLSGQTPPPAAVPAVPEPPQTVLHHIVFWNNGFTVDDGPLRMFDDPENASFLEVNNLIYD
jgi:UBX domain-containing protein 1